MAKHTKMYKDSPKIEKDESGKPALKKGEKKAEEVNAGTDGEAEKGKPELDMYHKHAKERLDLTQKHEKEHHELASKHMKEAGGDEKTGEEKIEKIEDKKGE